MGKTKNDMGGSLFYQMNGKTGKNVPEVDARSALKTYNSLHTAISKSLVESAHDCSFGGLAVCLAEKAFSGNLGMKIDLSKLDSENCLTKDFLALFSESASRIVVTVAKKNRKKFGGIFREQSCSLIGTTTQKPLLEITGMNGKKLISLPLGKMKTEWQKQFRGW